jgi:hypothetical protein
MASLDRPKGFEPYGTVRHIGIYKSGAEIFRGDMVALQSDGLVDPVGTGEIRCLGVAAEYVAAADTDLRVYDHVDQEFVVQCDDSGIDAQTDIGNTANILTTAGNAQFQHSRMELDGSDLGTTTDAQLRVMRIELNPNNEFGANAEVVVRVNNHELANNTAV